MKYSETLARPTDGLIDYQRTYPASRDWRHFHREARGAFDELSDALSRQQRGLCAYCEIDLRTTAETNARQIEHWRPKSLDQKTPTNWTFDVGNLQMACLGGSKAYPIEDVHRTGNPAPGPNISCGQFKDDRDPEHSDLVMQQRPYRTTELPETPSMFNVDPDGTLRPIPDAANFGLETSRLQATIDFLHLNCTRLKLAREEIRQSLDDKLEEYAPLGSDDTTFNEALEMLASEYAILPQQNLPPFLTVIRTWFGRSFETLLFPKTGWAIG